MRNVAVETHVVPRAGTTSVCALVPGKLVDEHTSIAVVVPRTGATTSLAARSVSRAVRLGRVLEGTGLRFMAGSVQSTNTVGKMEADLVVPGACTPAISALESGVHVDEDAAVAVEVGGALAVPASTIARECNGLAGERAFLERAQPEVDVGRGADVNVTSASGCVG